VTDQHLLVAGEKATILLPAITPTAPLPVIIATVEAPRLESTLAWKVGRLEFTETPLAEVVAEFNRYNRHQLRIVDPVLASEAFGGSFAPGGYESLIDVLQQSFDVVAERRGSETLLRRNTSGPGSR
jgi:transmembrane sensor